MPRGKAVEFGRWCFATQEQASTAIRLELKTKSTHRDGSWEYGKWFRSEMLSDLIRDRYPDPEIRGHRPTHFQLKPHTDEKGYTGYDLYAMFWNPRARDDTYWHRVSWRKCIERGLNSPRALIIDGLRHQTKSWMTLDERRVPCTDCGVEGLMEVDHVSPTFAGIIEHIEPLLTKDFTKALMADRDEFRAANPDGRWSPYTHFSAHPAMVLFHDLHESGVREAVCHDCHHLRTIRRKESQLSPV